MEPSISGVDILIVTALTEELKIHQGHIGTGEIHHSKSSSLTYFQFQENSPCNDNTYSVAITCLFDMGNLNAGIEATKAIQELMPEYVIMHGIAAGIRNSVDLEDVIVATKILAELKPDVQEVRPQSISTDSYLRKKLEHFSSQVRKP